MKITLDQDQALDRSTVVLSTALEAGGMTDEGVLTEGRRMKIQVPILALTLLLAVAGLALTHSTVQRPRMVLSGGASDSGAGDQSTTLRATLGQPVVGVLSSSTGDITLGQGFWHRGGQPGGGYSVHLPLIVSN